MANEQHLKILEHGINAWNQWRRQNAEVIPDEVPDLSEAKLSGQDLREAKLYKAKLQKVDLSGTKLSGADLGATDLRRVKLCGANLSDANLSDANLRGANLKGAKLRHANLSWAFLAETALSGAEFDRAVLNKTVFANVDLSQVQSLASVKHLAPSEISTSTIYRSQGNIPEVFLRGAGVPDPFITNMKSLVTAMSAADFYSCFISYSNKDRDFAERLYADLQAKGVRCWFAPEDLKTGDPFRQRIDDAIRRHDRLLVILSETPVASAWVESEVEAALERERKAVGEVVLFPIRLDEAVMCTELAWAADIRRKRHMGDFSGWQNHDSYQKAFQRLLRDLHGVS